MVNYQNLTRNFAWTQFQRPQTKDQGYLLALAILFGYLIKGVGSAARGSPSVDGLAE